jgi:HD-like signal output (HDOD) protein
MNNPINNPIHILFVDDEPNVLNGLQRMLRNRRLEWRMEFAAGGKEALLALEKNHYDLIVSDMRMPEMDGVELLTKVKEIYPHIMRIALSGQSSKETVLHIVGPIHQYLQKPCDAQSLKNTIDHISSLKGMLSNIRLSNLIGQMETLPCMSGIYSELISELQSPDSSIKKIARIISSDVGMSMKILKVVNSSYFGVRQLIASIPQAVMLLGMDIVKSLVLMTKIFSQFNPTACDRFSYEIFWEHSMTVGQWAQAIARMENLDAQQSDAAMIAGMFHDVGKLVLADKMPDYYQQVLAMVKEDISLCQMEREVLGCTHAEVGAYLFGLWGFPHEMITATMIHHDPRQIVNRDIDIVSIVFAANVLASETQSMSKNSPVGESDSDSLIAEWKHVSRIDAWRELRPEAQKACCR